MEKDKRKYLTVSEVAKILGVNVTTIRYYNRAGLIWSERDENNYRYYDESQIPNFKIILYLRKMGFSVETIKEIKEHLICKDYNFVLEQIKELEKEYKKEIEEIYKKMESLEKCKRSIEYLNEVLEIAPDYIEIDSATHRFKLKDGGVFYIKNYEGQDFAVYYVDLKTQLKISDREAVNTLYEKVEENGYMPIGDLKIETVNSVLNTFDEDRIVNPTLNAFDKDRKIKIFKIPIKSLT